MSESSLTSRETSMVGSSGDRAVNGRPADVYRQSVSSSRPPTKQEIQARLDLASTSIARRLESIQDELKLSSDTLRSLFGNPVVGVLAALGVGILVGKLFSGHRSRTTTGNSDALVDLLSREVDSAIEHGEPLDNAIERVIHSIGAVGDGTAPRSSGSSLKWIAGLALRSLVSQGIKAFTSGQGPAETDDDGLVPSGSSESD